MEQEIRPEDRIQIVDDLNGELISTRSAPKHPILPLEIESPKLTSSLPVLKTVEIMPPKCKENFLEVLSNSDPRVSFESLHLGLLDVIEETAGSRKRKRESEHLDDNAGREGDSLNDSITSLMVRPTIHTPGKGPVDESSYFLEVNPLHKIVSERNPFTVKPSDVYKISGFNTKKDLAVLAGSKILDLLQYSKSVKS